MLKTSLLALIASAGFAFAIAPAHAVSMDPPPCDCRTDPGDGTTPSTHPIGAPGTDKPGKTNHPSEEPLPDPTIIVAGAENVCNTALGGLRKVTRAQVLSFTTASGVQVRPVCEGSALLKHLAVIDNSQAAPFHGMIAANVSMSGPLAQHGYKAGDVVGIIVKDEMAILYVHRGHL